MAALGSTINVQPVRTPKYQSGSYQLEDAPTRQLLKSNLADAGAVRAQLSLGAKPLFYKSGMSILHLACEAKSATVVALLLDAYISDAQEDEFALQDALSARSDVNQETPLLTSCRVG